MEFFGFGQLAGFCGFFPENTMRQLGQFCKQGLCRGVERPVLVPGEGATEFPSQRWFQAERS